MAERGFKRQRANGDAVVFVAAKRAVQKEVITVQKAAVDGSQSSTTIFTATVPGTMEGLRWDIAAMQDAGTGNTTMRWAIVLVKSGDSANNISATDAATFYSPEGNLLVSGLHIQSGIDINTPNSEKGSTKTRRKMMAGDTIQMIMVAAATNTWAVSGIVQMFYKS